MSQTAVESVQRLPGLVAPLVGRDQGLGLLPDLLGLPTGQTAIDGERDGRSVLVTAFPANPASNVQLSRNT